MARKGSSIADFVRSVHILTPALNNLFNISSSFAENRDKEFLVLGTTSAAAHWLSKH